MNSIELGKKIREIRLSKHMTQNDVVGTFITRNMLSQIENGSAYPSIKTLEYIANVLEIPLEQLMSADPLTEAPAYSAIPDNNADVCGAEASHPDYISILCDAKNKYKSQKYKEVIDLMSAYSDKSCPVYDEANALLARAFFESAKLSHKNRDLTTASEYANQAVVFASNGIYSSDELMMKAYRIIKDSDNK